MPDRPPILPFHVDQHEPVIAAPCSTIQRPEDVEVPQYDDKQTGAVLGGVVTAEPDSDSNSIVSREGVWLAPAPVSYVSGLRYERRERL